MDQRLRRLERKRLSSSADFADEVLYLRAKFHEGTREWQDRIGLAVALKDAAATASGANIFPDRFLVKEFQRTPIKIISPELFTIVAADAGGCYPNRVGVINQREFALMSLMVLQRADLSLLDAQEIAALTRLELIAQADYFAAVTSPEGQAYEQELLQLETTIHHTPPAHRSLLDNAQEFLHDAVYTALRLGAERLDPEAWFAATCDFMRSYVHAYILATEGALDDYYAELNWQRDLLVDVLLKRISL